MKAALWVNRVLLTLLSISTGAVKLAYMADEMRIFRAAGIPDPATFTFGLLQLGAGLLLLPPKTSRRAAWVMAGTFCLATGVLLLNSLYAFAAFSLLFIAMGVIHAKWGQATGVV